LNQLFFFATGMIGLSHTRSGVGAVTTTGAGATVSVVAFLTVDFFGADAFFLVVFLVVVFFLFAIGATLVNSCPS